MAGDSGSGGGGGRAALGASNSKAARKRLKKSAVGGKAGIPFKSGFRTAAGQKAFKTKGGRNTAAPGTLRGAAAKGKKGKKKR